MAPHRRPLVAAALVGALALSGCAGGASSASDGVFTIVTSTTVYADIAAAIAGDAAEVTPIIASASRDPHEYEATAADQLTVAGADLLIVNGGGYDGFVDTLVDATGTTAPVLTATGDAGHDHGEHEDADEHGDHEDDGHDHGANEHVWYDPAAMGAFATVIATELGELLPDDADTFQANLDTFLAGIDGLDAELAGIRAEYGGTRVLATEPVAGYLLEAAGLDDVTPPAFSEAVEEGQDVPPAVLLDVLELIADHGAGAVVANAQTGGAETDRVIAAATDAGIPVVEFTESLPDGQTYLQWMEQNVTDLAEALSR
ncbi:metal ABC transporter solute-binding protein, Zn/Mn family [Microbacterium sp. GXF7504]